MTAISINLPEDLVDEIGKDKAEKLALEALLVKLYDLGEISSGKAARVLGISRREFLDLLGAYHVSIFDETMNLSEDLQNAERALGG